MTEKDMHILSKQELPVQIADEIEEFCKKYNMNFKEFLIDMAYRYGVIQGIRQERAKRKNKSIKKD